MSRKALFSKSVSKNREVCTPETSCMKRTSAHIKSMLTKQLSEIIRFEILLRLSGCEKFSEPSRNGPLIRVVALKMRSIFLLLSYCDVKVFVNATLALSSSALGDYLLCKVRVRFFFKIMSSSRTS